MLEREIYLLNKYCLNGLDVGSNEIKIILFTIKIEKLDKHFKKNHKDKNSKSILKNTIDKRKKLIKLLIREKKYETVKKLSEDLNIKNIFNLYTQKKRVYF